MPISGSQLAMARRTLGFSRRRLAAEALTCWQTINLYEIRGDTPLPATPIVDRLVGVLEQRGVQFRDDGLFISRGVPLNRATIHSEATA
jgi:hypothetical protein